MRYFRDESENLFMGLNYCRCMYSVEEMYVYKGCLCDKYLTPLSVTSYCDA